MFFQVPKLNIFLAGKLSLEKIKLFLIFCLVHLTLNAQKNQFILTLDAGHGGHDKGANYFGNYEKEVTLGITLKLGKKIEREQKDVKVIYTRKEDSYPELYRRAEIANNSKSNLFISVHCNSSGKVGSAQGTEVWVLGAHNSKKKNDNFDVVSKENSVVFLEKNYKENYDGYDPNSPESVIGMTLVQDKFLQNSLDFAQLVDKNLQYQAYRPNRGIKQGPFLVLVKTAMPAVLIETGFINHPSESAFLASEDGQTKIADAIYDAFVKYKKEFYQKSGINTTPSEKPVENTEFKVLFLNSHYRYDENTVQFRGLKNIEIIKINDKYFYYSGNTSYKKQAETNLKEVKDAGFTDAKLVEFKPKNPINDGVYKIELMFVSEKYKERDSEMKGLQNVERNKLPGRMFQYLYGNYKTLEQAKKSLDDVKKLGFIDAIIIKQ